MAEFQKSKKSRELAYSRATTLLLFAFSVILMVGLFNIVPKQRDTRENRDLVINQLETLKDQGASLASEIESLKTQSGVEEKIREKFRVVKDGEGLVVIVDEKDSNDMPAAEESSGLLNFLKKLFD